MKALIVAGETSGDLYGGELASALKHRIPSFELAGMGGDRMALAGVELLYHCRDVAVVGVFEVFSKLLHLKQADTRIRDWVLKDKPDFAVLIDFPDFNFRLARFLKKNGIDVFYFISPQVWAWRKNRVRFLKSHVDLMISILPFEKEFFESAGVQVKYVGHPLVEMVNREVSVQPVYEKGSVPLLGMMPGSRDVEMKRHLPVLLKTAALIRRELEVNTVFIWPPALEVEAYSLPSSIRIEKISRYSAMRACDLLLVASGTSTLEAAILGVPLFVVYRVGFLSWQLGKFLVRVPYYGLVNWIAQKKCIPEYIQDRMKPSLLAADAIAFLKDQQRSDLMKINLAKIVDSLGPPGAIERAADAILEKVHAADL